MLHWKTILCPTDFSAGSRCALELASALARAQAARLVLLHVLPYPAPIGADPQVPAFKDAHTDEDLRTYRQEMAGRLDSLGKAVQGIDVRTLLREGDVASTIIRAAEEVACDVIVLSNHRASSARWLLAAPEVVRRAPCAVVTIDVPAPRGTDG